MQRGAQLNDGRTITRELVVNLQKEELERIREAVGGQEYEQGRYQEAAGLFEQVALSKTYVEFLTLPAYEQLLKGEKWQVGSGE